MEVQTTLLVNYRRTSPDFKYINPDSWMPHSTTLSWYPLYGKCYAKKIMIADQRKIIIVHQQNYISASRCAHDDEEDPAWSNIAINIACHLFSIVSHLPLSLHPMIPRKFKYQFYHCYKANMYMNTLRLFYIIKLNFLHISVRNKKISLNKNI